MVNVLSLALMDAVSVNRNNHVCVAPHEEAKASMNTVTGWAFFQCDVSKMLATLKADVFSMASMDDVSINTHNNVCVAPHKEAEASKNVVPVLDIFQ